MIITSNQAENDALLIVAKLMITAARTAPKAQGKDSIKTAIITGDDKEKLAQIMEENGHVIDSSNVRDSGAVVLIGVEYGRKNKSDLSFEIELLDLGIAIGSAVKIASTLNVDNRVMHSIGIAAARLNIFEADVIQGVPLSIKGKNIFFDRKKDKV